MEMNNVPKIAKIVDWVAGSIVALAIFIILVLLSEHLKNKNRLQQSQNIITQIELRNAYRQGFTDGMQSTMRHFVGQNMEHLHTIETNLQMTIDLQPILTDMNNGLIKYTNKE